MLLEFQKRSDAVLRAKQVPIVLPARAVPSPHRGVLANARIGANGRLLTLGQDGAMAVWKPSRRGITPMKELRMELQSRTAPGGTKSWATDFAPLLQMHKIVVASGQRELWFYDLRTMQPSFVVTQLEETPLRLDCAYDEQARATVVIVGDHKGTLAALTFPDFYESAQAFRGMGSADPTKDVLRVSLGTIQGGGADLGGVTYTRWAVHNDWVVGLVYAASLRAIISASNDEATALVVGDILRPATAAPKTLDIDPEGDMAFMFQTTGMRRNPKQRSFFIPRGCKAMCFSDARCMVATGGLDRTIRVWNPYVNANPSGLLKGHCSPILALCIDDGPGRLYVPSRLPASLSLVHVSAAEAACRSSLPPCLSPGTTTALPTLCTLSTATWLALSDDNAIPLHPMPTPDPQPHTHVSATVAGALSVTTGTVPRRTARSRFGTWQSSFASKPSFGGAMKSAVNSSSWRTCRPYRYCWCFPTSSSTWALARRPHLGARRPSRTHCRCSAACTTHAFSTCSRPVPAASSRCGKPRRARPSLSLSASFRATKRPRPSRPLSSTPRQAASSPARQTGV